MRRDPPALPLLLSLAVDHGKSSVKSSGADAGFGRPAAHWTRLSCHRFRANEVRLQLSVLARRCWAETNGASRRPSERFPPVALAPKETTVVEFRNILCSIDLSDASARPLVEMARRKGPCGNVKRTPHPPPLPGVCRGHDGKVKQGEQESLHARDSVGQTSGATQRCLKPGCSQRIGNSRRTR